MIVGPIHLKEIVTPLVFRNDLARIQGTTDYLLNRSTNYPPNNCVSSSIIMFPQQPKNSVFGGLDVRLRGSNGRISSQGLLRGPRQEVLSSGRPESQLPWQGLVQEPDEQRCGNSEKGIGFSKMKFVHQQQTVQQEQESRSESTEQQQHDGQYSDCPRQHSMHQLTLADYLETSYSALLHGPDTPPFHSQPAWDTSAEGKHHSAAEYSIFPSKGVTVKDPASLNGCEGAPAHFGTHNFWPEQLKTKQKLLTKDVSNSEGADAKDQAPFNPKMGLQMQHPVRHSVEKHCSSHHQVNPQQGFPGPRFSQHLPNQEWAEEKQNFFRPCEKVDTSLPNNGPSFMQSEHCMMSFNLEKKDVNSTHPQPQEDNAEGSVFKQHEGMALPSKAIPTGHTPNGFDPQQYRAWNAMRSQSATGASGSHMQHASHTGYNRWDTSTWLEGHPSMQHTPYLPYGSGHMQIGANHHAPYNWQTQSTGTMTDAYSHYYPEGYYSCGNNFASIGESNNAAPVEFVNYNHHYQEPRVYLPPANYFSPGFRTPVIGAECNNNLNRSLGPQVLAIQKDHERQNNVGGQVRQFHSTCEDPHVIQSANIIKKSREEEAGKNSNADKENAFYEKDVELEGPQAKKLRECSEVDAYHLKSCQVSPQTGAASSMNVAELSGVDGTPTSSRNSSDVHGSALHSSVKDHGSLALSHSCGFESGTDQQGRSSEVVARTFQRSGTPSHLWTRDDTQSETPANLISGHSLYRNQTGSTSSFMYYSENSAWISQSDTAPGVRFFPGAQQMQEHQINNSFIPGGFHDGYKEQFPSNRTNICVSRVQEQFSTDLVMRQLGGRSQAASPPGAHISLKASTFQQLPMPAIAPKSAFCGIKVSSGASIQELPDSQCATFKPSNIGEGPSSTNMSNVSYQDTLTEQYAYSTPGYSYSSTVDKDEYLASNLHHGAEQQRTSYAMTGAYPSHLRTSAETPELNHSNAVPLETGTQPRVFGRPALEKFYPPPPFQSHSLHLQRESGRVANTPSEGENLSEVQALENSEAAMLTGAMKERAMNPMNYQPRGGYMVEGGFIYPATGGSGMTRRGSLLSDSAQMHQMPASSIGAGNVNRQQPGNTVMYAHAAHRIPSKTIASHTHSSSITVGSQGSAGPTQMLRDSDTLMASQPSGYPDPLAGRHANEDQHPPLRHCNDIHTVDGEYSTLIDGEAATFGKTLSEQVPQQPLRANLRAPLTMQPKKRKKSVPCLIPWHIVTAQPKGQLPSLSKAELMWTTATNRLVDKDGGEVSNMGIFRAESRLRLTTQLMQQIFSPLPSAVMHGKQPVSLECGVYNLSKSALGEACRLMAGTERENESAQKITDIKIIPSNGQTRTWNMAKELAMTRLVERFMERVKRLDFELARLDCSMSVLEVRGKSHDFERLSIVHRLGKQHGPDFCMNLSETRSVDAITNRGPPIRKTHPQKYVIAVPMPRTLPEGVRCLSL